MSDLRSQLLEIREEHGQLTPEIVVEATRSKSHPLHSRVFDRAPRDAAQAWYRHRAHELIQEAKISYRQPGKPTETMRAFHAVPREGGYVYEPAEVVVADPLSRELVLREMEREWKQLRNRYEQFVEFAQMVKRDVEAA